MSLFPAAWRVNFSRTVSLATAAALASLAANPARAQPSATPAATPPSLAAILDQAAQRLPAGGIVGAEITPTSIVYAGAGAFAPRKGLPPEKVLFEIGSITKLFTGLLLAHAVNEGKAALADPIAKHLPAGLKLRPAVAAITLEQLATHTSGMPSLPANFHPRYVLNPYGDYSVEQLHAWLQEYDPAQPAPQPHSYSNVGFGLLGQLLGRIYGRPWAALVREKITGPLGMADTTVTLNAERLARFALPYSGSQRVSPWSLPALAGAGALRSTAADLGKFAQALLMGQPEWLEAAWDLARQPRVAMARQNGHVGLGIFMAQRGEETIYNHGGGTGGFRAHLELSPATRRAFVLWGNNDSFDPGGMAGRLRAGANALAAFAPVVREEMPITAEKIAEFPGVYAADAGRRLTFILDEGGGLRARLTGQPFVPVFFGGADRFFAQAVAIEFQFVRDAAGQLTGVTLHQDGAQMTATRTAASPPKVFFPPAEKLRDYAGRYEFARDRLLEVEVRGTTLGVKLTGQPVYPVHNDAPDHFVYDIVEAALTFERDAAGKVKALVLHQNGNHRAPRLRAETK